MKWSFSFLMGFLLLFAARPASAEEHAINVVKVFDGSSISVNTTNATVTLDLSGYKPINFSYSLQVLATNPTSTGVCGKVQIVYDVSNDGSSFLLGSNVTAEISYTNSPTAGGKGFFVFSPGISRYLRLRAIVTETNSFLHGWLAVQ
jgi:hypothetical protein